MCTHSLNYTLYVTTDEYTGSEGNAVKSAEVLKFVAVTDATYVRSSEILQTIRVLLTYFSGFNLIIQTKISMPWTWEILWVIARKGRGVVGRILRVADNGWVAGTMRWWILARCREGDEAHCNVSAIDITWISEWGSEYGNESDACQYTWVYLARRMRHTHTAGSLHSFARTCAPQRLTSSGSSGKRSHTGSSRLGRRFRRRLWQWRRERRFLCALHPIKFSCRVTTRRCSL